MSRLLSMWVAMLALGATEGPPRAEPRRPKLNAPSNPYGNRWGVRRDNRRRWSSRDNRPSPDSEEGKRRIAAAEAKRALRRARNRRLFVLDGPGGGSVPPTAD